jgi:hypothetical protein
MRIGGPGQRDQECDRFRSIAQREVREPDARTVSANGPPSASFVMFRNAGGLSRRPAYMTDARSHSPAGFQMNEMDAGIADRWGAADARGISSDRRVPVDTLRASWFVLHGSGEDFGSALVGGLVHVRQGTPTTRGSRVIADRANCGARQASVVLRFARAPARTSVGTGELCDSVAATRRRNVA